MISQHNIPAHLRPITSCDSSLGDLAVNRWGKWEGELLSAEVATKSITAFAALDRHSFPPGFASCEPQLSSQQELRLSDLKIGMVEKARRYYLSTKMWEPSEPEGKVHDARLLIPQYFHNLLPSYREIVEGVSNLIPHIERTCRISAVIPCALSQEHAFIHETLSCFGNQTANATSFEIFVLGNFTSEQAVSHAHDIEKTKQEIKRAQGDFPHLRIYVANIELRHPRLATIGFLRSLGNDVVMRRWFLTGSSSDHYMLRLDADTRRVGPRYIEAFIEQLNANPHVDSVMGRIEWSPERFSRNPLLCVAQVLDQLLSYQTLMSTGRLFWNGPNLAMRASAYAAIGGYRVTSKLGEDAELMRRLLAYRKDSEERVPVIQGNAYTRLSTSTRRVEFAYRRGVTLSPDQWDSAVAAFGPDNHGVRTIQESAGESPSISDDELASGIETIVQRTIGHSQKNGWYVPLTATSPVLVRILTRTLGVDFEPDGPTKIRVSSVEGLRRRLMHLSGQGIVDWRNGHQAVDRPLVSPRVSLKERAPKSGRS